MLLRLGSMLHVARLGIDSRDIDIWLSDIALNFVEAVEKK